MDDITIFRGRCRYRSGMNQQWRLYYYEGNFYYPIELPRKESQQVKNLIKLFIKNNSELVATDRSKPDYKTKLELFDEQCGEY